MSISRPTSPTVSFVCYQSKFREVAACSLHFYVVSPGVNERTRDRHATYSVPLKEEMEVEIPQGAQRVSVFVTNEFKSIGGMLESSIRQMSPTLELNLEESSSFVVQFGKDDRGLRAIFEQCLSNTSAPSEDND